MQEEVKTPEQRAWFLSKLYFIWMEPLIWKGFKKPLEETDLFPLASQHQSESISQRFKRNWKGYKLKKQLQQTDSSQITRMQRWRLKWSLLLAMHHTFGLKFYLAGILKLFNDLCEIIAPLLMKQVIEFVTLPAEKTPIFSYEWWYGILNVVLLFLIQMISLVLFQQFFHITMVRGMELRTGLRSLIYEKLLRLSSEERASLNSGDVITLISVDSGKLGDLLGYLHYIWTCLVQIIIVLGLLIGLLGYPALIGVFILIIAVPINTLITTLLGKLRRKVLKATGERIKMINEVLQGIRVIKFYAWEKSFQKVIGQLRRTELIQVAKIGAVAVLSSFVMYFTPIFVSISTFSLYSISNTLDATIIFPALSLFSILRMPINMLPGILSMLAEAKVSMDRIQTFVVRDEVQNLVSKEEDIGEDIAIQVEEGEFSWKTNATEIISPVKQPSEKYSTLQEEEEIKDKNESNTEESASSPSAGTLHDITFSVPKGKLTCIIGKVASGKSSMLQAIIGEMKQIHGTVNINGSISYCPQLPWIMHGALKQNILFGQQFDEQKYDTTLQVCALKKDLETLPQQDETEIGERGINLSGGQRQRVSIARAVYSDSDIYLFDDCLSAVDNLVAKQIFHDCFRGHLKSKTRVLVMNQWYLLPYADHIIVMEKGTIVAKGTLKQVMDSQTDTSALLQQFFSKQGSSSSNLEQIEASTMNLVSSDSNIVAVTTEEKKEKKANNALMQEEERAVGSVKWKIYFKYILYTGPVFMIPIIVLLFIFVQSADISISWWLSFWSDHTSEYSLGFFIGIYVGIAAIASVSQIIREATLIAMALHASSIFHSKALTKVLRTPVKFFDTTPLGRIINRFSKDIESVDSSVVMNVRGFVTLTLQLIGLLATIVYVFPFFLIPLIPIAIIYYVISLIYRASARELKRMESISRSPVFSHFSESLQGTNTIRAYNQVDRFIKLNHRKLDDNNKVYFCQLAASRWLGTRLEIIGRSLVAVTALFAIFFKDAVSSGMLGLALSYCLQVTASLNWVVRTMTELEISFNSVERLLYYAEELEEEAPAIIKDNRVPDNWPQKGQIELDQVEMRYRDDLDPVLKQISATIVPKEKVGIVGRTGSGKSSLLLCLLRIVELQKGKIEIDGVDISTIGLEELRSKISIIPQDPVLFSGSVRFNLDPFATYTEAELWSALERVHLKSAIENLPLQLDNEVGESGSTFSVGERQLICIARALLRKSKILLADEATANIDVTTDELIQETIRKEFVDRTTITIAHRINTIIDSDKIMLLDHGELKEFDTPSSLLTDEASLFYSLSKEAGIQNNKTE